MKVHSQLPYREYLLAMKQQMDSFFAFGMERFTGIILGRFFSVTYHSGYEWNHRITNEKNRAIGFVRPRGDGTEVVCIRLSGLTNPLSLICLFAVFFLCGSVSSLRDRLIFSAVATVFTAGGTAITDSCTERGEEGGRVVSAFLINPSDFYSTVY